MTTLTIELDGQLEADLSEAIARTGVPRQEFVREALRRQLALVRLGALQKEWRLKSKRAVGLRTTMVRGVS